jgi:putative membrane protein
MYILLRWLVSAVALLGIAYFIPGIRVAGFYSALIAALILGLVNAVIRPIIILLTLPVNILTLGLFTFVINAFLFWFVATVVKGFEVSGFWPAFWGALIVSVIGWIMSSVTE